MGVDKIYFGIFLVIMFLLGLMALWSFIEANKNKNREKEECRKSSCSNMYTAFIILVGAYGIAMVGFFIGFLGT